MHSLKMEVLEYIINHDRCELTEVADALGRDYETIKTAVILLAKEGKIKKPQVI